MKARTQEPQGSQTAPRPVPPEILGAAAAHARVEQALQAAVGSESVPGITLTTSLPRRLARGRATALFLEGFCHPRDSVLGLEVLVNGRRHPVQTFGMPIPGAIGPGCFWWTLLELEASELASDEVRFELRARLEMGGEKTSYVGACTTATEPDLPAPAVLADGVQRPGLVCVCMATYNPEPEQFARQLESIRSQTHTAWVCVISDDCSEPERFAALERIAGGDPRIAVSRSEERLGFYENFERALAMAPAEAEFACFSDQDDYWYPEKIATLVGEMRPGVQLAYSDMRIVLEAGEVLSETYWSHRQNNYENLGSLLLANTITGAASLFRRDLLETALPFPPRHGEMYHDHWVALVALALGRIAYVDRPLYDYIQHGGAVLGYANANASVLRQATRSRFARARDRWWRIWFHGHHVGWRSYYFRVLTKAAVLARILDQRCAPRMSRRKRRTLSGLLSAEAAIPFRSAAWLAVRAVRSQLGAREAVGMETIALRALLWRRFAGIRRRQQRGEPCRHGLTTPPPETPIEHEDT